MNIKIIEGPRGVGKSTVAQLLRHYIEGSTLINLTGFKLDGEAGLEKIQRYYDALFSYLEMLDRSGHDYTVIFDRIFFSEMVYAPLYKNYNFKPIYDYLCNELTNLGDVEIYFFHVTDEEVLQDRLVRDKVELFGTIKESVKNSLEQQELYKTLFDDFADQFDDLPTIKLFKIDTSSLTPYELKDIILNEE